MSDPGATTYATDTVNTGVSIAYLPSSTKPLALEALLRSLGWVPDAVTGRWVRVEKQHSGVWLGFRLTPGDAALVAPNGAAEDDLHVTLAYVTAPLGNAALQALLGAVTALMLETPPVQAQVGSVARFTASDASDGQDVVVALVDSADLEQVRQRTCALLETLGIQLSMAHGYTPHITLAYSAPGTLTTMPVVPAGTLTFATLTVKQGDVVLATVPLQGQQEVQMGNGRLLKTDVPLRYTLGIVYEPDETDTQGDFAKAETIRKACWDFTLELQKSARMTKSVLTVLYEIRKTLEGGQEARIDVTDLFAALVEKEFKGLGDQHETWDQDAGDIVEVYIAPVAMEIDGQPVKKGAWLMGCLWSPDAFVKVQTGERTGWSMGGWSNFVLGQEVA